MSGWRAWLPVLVVCAAVGVALAVRAWAAGGLQPNLQPGPARIKVQATLVRTRHEGAVVARMYTIWNRPAYKTSIGLAALVCRTTSPTRQVCQFYLRLQRGQIIGGAMEGRGATFHELAVLGGTGYYSNTGGSITIQPLASNTAVIYAVLEAF